MELQTRQEGQVTIVRLAGRLDLGSIRLLQDGLKGFLDRGTRVFLLRMVDVTDLSSSGVARLLQLKQSAEAGNATLALLEPSAVVEYVLDLAGMGDQFRRYDDEATALLELGGARRPHRPSALDLPHMDSP